MTTPPLTPAQIAEADRRMDELNLVRLTSGNVCGGTGYKDKVRHILLGLDIDQPPCEGCAELREEASRLLLKLDRIKRRNKRRHKWKYQPNGPIKNTVECDGCGLYSSAIQALLPEFARGIGPCPGKEKP